MDMRKFDFNESMGYEPEQNGKDKRQEMSKNFLGENGGIRDPYFCQRQNALAKEAADVLGRNKVVTQPLERLPTPELPIARVFSSGVVASLESFVSNREHQSEDRRYLGF